MLPIYRRYPGHQRAAARVLQSGSRLRPLAGLNIWRASISGGPRYLAGLDIWRALISGGPRIRVAMQQMGTASARRLALEAWRYGNAVYRIHIGAESCYNYPPLKGDVRVAIPTY